MSMAQSAGWAEGAGGSREVLRDLRLGGGHDAAGFLDDAFDATRGSWPYY